MADYAALFSNPFARMILIVGFVEGALAWGAFAYIGANLHLRFDLSFTLVGLTVACFGVGGLIYSGLVRLLVYRLGQTGLTVVGGFFISAAYIVLAFQPAWWFAPIAVTIVGLGFYMFHNTLQTIATAHRVPLWAVTQINPGVGDRSLIPGERVIVPRHLVPMGPLARQSHPRR